MKGRKQIGTNYYLLKKRIKSTSDLDKGMHIGKSSCGWVFHFQAFPKIKKVKQMKKVTLDGYIYNEYGEEFTYRDFWYLVESTKIPDENGKKYVLVDPRYPHVLSPFDEWEDEGFAFTMGDFC